MAQSLPGRPRMKIWIDIDNSPHVPFFRPIVAALKARGDSVLITTRRYAQTIQLLEDSGLEFVVVGEHAGAGRLRKISNLLARSFALSQVVRSFAPDVALSHGSRALSIAAWIMNIPSLLLFDYEWTEMHIFKRCASILACPKALPDSALKEAALPLHKIQRYDGLKENVYLSSFSPDPTFRSQLDIPDDATLLTVRPSSMTSNYHDRRSEHILVALLRLLKTQANVIAIVTPRTETDRALVQSVIDREGLINVRIPDRALPGMQLLYWSDIVVSGGGTMNREAALLGTPTYSMFTGRRPAVDTYLASLHKLHFLEQPDDVDQLVFRPRTRSLHDDWKNTSVLTRILELVDQCSQLR